MQEEVRLSENVTESTSVEPFPQNGHLEEGAHVLSDCEESKV